ncbi:undecaprenyl-phosphate glucose phosphotransferase [Polycyclovorans algicola]|uniref:undecaprenyl-phosphate glucose phosphotransferase n=1 Tax=Polycyclovorans algicola TaxID=616992 RepID=UPI00069398D6|nr:undecaprenyl-phosphate glucose phosphotransferase [Polycyclovorans algicola]
MNPSASRSFVLQGLFFAFLTALPLYLLAHFLDVEWSRPYQSLAVLAGVLAFILLRRFDLTAHWRFGRPDSIANRFLIAWGMLIGGLALAGFVLQYAEFYSRLLLGVWMVVTPFFIALVHLMIRVLMRRYAPDARLKRRAVLVFASDSARLLERGLRNTEDFEVLGYFDDRDADRTDGGVGDLPLLGKARDVAQYTKDNHIEVVFVVLPDNATKRVVGVLEALGDTTASVYYVPDFLAFQVFNAQFVEVAGFPVLQVAESPFFGADGLLKAIFDRSFAALALLMLLPAFAIIAILIKRDSPGPVFFKQKRYGLNGKRFFVYKFRSMTVGDDLSRQQQQATQDDDRITRIGRFMRKTSIDELPQFWNVMRGEMSVVGPRPHSISHNEQYRKEVRRYMVRHKVKPGVTGWAQVNGLRGETAQLERMAERIEYDLDYIRNWSPWLDLKIIFLTVWTIARGDENAY